MFSVDRQSFQSLSALALFTFAFLGSEFFFDSRIGLLISAEGVVGAQAMILGASVVGFLAYAPISKRFGRSRPSGLLRPWSRLPLRKAHLRCKSQVVSRSSCWGALGLKRIGAWRAPSREARRLPRGPAQLTPPASCCNS